MPTPGADLPFLRTLGAYKGEGEVPTCFYLQVIIHRLRSGGTKEHFI